MTYDRKLTKDQLAKLRSESDKTGWLTSAQAEYLFEHQDYLSERIDEADRLAGVLENVASAVETFAHAHFANHGPCDELAPGTCWIKNHLSAIERALRKAPQVPESADGGSQAGVEAAANDSCGFESRPEERSLTLEEQLAQDDRDCLDAYRTEGRCSYSFECFKAGWKARDKFIGEQIARHL